MRRRNLIHHSLPTINKQPDSAMIASKETPATRDRSIFFNRILYGVFILLSIYFLLANRDIESSMANLGIALVFDPFDQRVAWSARRLYQRVWLWAHVASVLILFGLFLFGWV